MEKLNQDSIFAKYGLFGIENISFKKNNLVVGENGSGKTRFLQAVKEKLKQEDKYTVMYAYFPQISCDQKFVEEDEVLENRKKYEALNESLFDVFKEKRSVEFDDFLKYIELDGVSFLEELILQINSKYSSRIELSKKTLEKLNELFSDFINRELVISGREIYFKNCTPNSNIDSEETFEMALSRFSPGEKMLFYLSVFLLLTQSIYGSCESLVIVLDEPELHLHTKALIKLIKFIKENINYIQLWIATHAYNLIPYFDFDELVYIENSTVLKRNSKLYKSVYDSLVGYDEVVLHNFLTSLDTWDYCNYIAECFSLPINVETSKKNDEQFIKFKNSIEEKSVSKKNYKVLDFGGGTGRIAKCLSMLKDKNQEENFFEINYSIYDQVINEDNCEGYTFYTDPEYINTTKDTYDCILLMNTLHELDIHEWVDLFLAFYRLLELDGCLLLAEVINLTHGEQPYGNSGFLILYKKQLCELFQCEEDNIIEVNFNDKDKTNFFIIPKTFLCNVRSSSIKRAMDSLYADCLNVLKDEYDERIVIAHKEKKVSENSKILSIRKYAFYSQLLINAKFASDSITEEKAAQYVIKTNGKSYLKLKSDTLKAETINEKELKSIQTYFRNRKDEIAKKLVVEIEKAVSAGVNINSPKQIRTQARRLFSAYNHAEVVNYLLLGVALGDAECLRLFVGTYELQCKSFDDLIEILPIRNNSDLHKSFIYNS